MLKRAARGVVDYVRSAPGTYFWLLILLVTTEILRHVDPQRRSTNIHYLLQDPLRVLIQSALWIDDGSWLLYVAHYRCSTRRPSAGWGPRGGWAWRSRATWWRRM